MSCSQIRNKVMLINQLINQAIHEVLQTFQEIPSYGYQMVLILIIQVYCC